METKIEHKQPITSLKKTLFGIGIGVLIGLIFGISNDSLPLGFACGAVIALSIALSVLFPATTKKRVIYIVVYTALVVAIFGVYFTTFNKVQIPVDLGKREVPEEIMKNFKIWAFLSSLLRLVHIILGLVATVCSILVAMDLKKITPARKKWLAFTAAISFSILSAFDLGDKANRTRRAWRHMNVALLRYEAFLTSKDELIKAYEEAEEIIGDVKPSPKEVPGKGN